MGELDLLSGHPIGQAYIVTGVGVFVTATLLLLYGLWCLWAGRKRRIAEHLAANEAALQCRHGVKRTKPCKACAREFAHRASCADQDCGGCAERPKHLATCADGRCEGCGPLEVPKGEFTYFKNVGGDLVCHRVWPEIPRKVEGVEPRQTCLEQGYVDSIYNANPSEEVKFKGFPLPAHEYEPKSNTVRLSLLDFLKLVEKAAHPAVCGPSPLDALAVINAKIDLGLHKFDRNTRVCEKCGLHEHDWADDAVAHFPCQGKAKFTVGQWVRTMASGRLGYITSVLHLERLDTFHQFVQFGEGKAPEKWIEAFLEPAVPRVGEWWENSPEHVRYGHTCPIPPGQPVQLLSEAPGWNPVIWEKSIREGCIRPVNFGRGNAQTFKPGDRVRVGDTGVLEILKERFSHGGGPAWRFDRPSDRIGPNWALETEIEKA